MSMNQKSQNTYEASSDVDCVPEKDVDRPVEGSLRSTGPSGLGKSLSLSDDYFNNLLKGNQSVNVPYVNGNTNLWTLGDSISSNNTHRKITVRPDKSKTEFNSKCTILENVIVWSEKKVPHKVIRWIHKKFFYMEWEDVSCEKCSSKLSCLVNKTFESGCKTK